METRETRESPAIVEQYTADALDEMASYTLVVTRGQSTAWVWSVISASDSPLLSGQHVPTLEEAQQAACSAARLYHTWTRLERAKHLGPTYGCQHGHADCSYDEGGPCWAEVERLMLRTLQAHGSRPLRESFAARYGCTWGAMQNILRLTQPVA